MAEILALRQQLAIFNTSHTPDLGTMAGFCGRMSALP
jgi:hypothetical protein